MALLFRRFGAGLLGIAGTNQVLLGEQVNAGANRPEEKPA
jgi:hypothetical protein